MAGEWADPATALAEQDRDSAWAAAGRAAAAQAGVELGAAALAHPVRIPAAVRVYGSPADGAELVAVD